MEIADILAETLKREDREALLNLHRHLHGLAAQGGVDCERLTKAHELVAVEVVRRGYVHGSELECGKQKGLVLPAPHAFLVWKGKQTAVAASPEFHAACGAKAVDVPLALVCEGEAYGLVTLGTPAVMDCKTFDLPEFTEEHRVRPEERRAWWPEAEKLFVYPIKDFQGFKELQRVDASGDGLCEVRFKQYRPPSEREATVLKQSEKLPKVIVLQPHAVSLTGSVLYGKHEPADTDVVLVGAEWREDEGQFVVPLTPTFKEKLERVLRAVYQSGNAVQYISEGAGATFDHLPLYSLALVRLPRLEIERVSELEPEMAEVGYDKAEVKALTTSAIERLLRGASAEVRKQAMQSYESDEVVPGRLFVPLKPMRPVEPSQRQLFSRFADFAREQGHWPLLVSAKRDGVRHTLHRKGDRIWVYSDDGIDNAERLPELVKRLKQVPGDWVLDSEIEFWRDGQHFPREAAAGAVHSGEGTENLVANVFAVVYWDGKDLHKEMFADTLPILDKLPVDTTSDKPLDAGKGRLNLIPQIEASEADFEKVCMATAYLPGVEGVVVRRPDLQNYPLDGDPGEPPVEFKWHKSAAYRVTVLGVTETATPDVFNYTYGVLAGDAQPSEPFELDGKTYLVIGKSFSTAEVRKLGDEIEIESETVNLTENEDGTVSVSFWVPNFIVEDTKGRRPDSETTNQEGFTDEKREVFKLLVEQVHGKKVVSLFAGQGLSESYLRAHGLSVFSNDSDEDVPAQTHFKAIDFIKEKLIEKWPVDLILFDDWGSPVEELKEFCEFLKAAPKHRFLLYLTDGGLYNAQARGPFKKSSYWAGSDETLKHNDKTYSEYEKFTRHLIREVARRSGYSVKELTLIRNSRNNALYGVYKFSPS